jgi:hypothetical protein
MFQGEGPVLRRRFLALAVAAWGLFAGGLFLTQATPVDAGGRQETTTTQPTTTQPTTATTEPATTGGGSCTVNKAAVDKVMEDLKGNPRRSATPA